MYKFAGFNPLRFGDLCINTCAARLLKQQYPDSHLTFLINNDYKEAAPLFLDHPSIDRIHILDKDKDGFNSNDINWVKSQKFDHVFNPMADHDHSKNWWELRNQPVEVAYMHGLTIPANEDGKCNLTKWFKVDNFSNYVAILPFPGYYSKNNDKTLTIPKAQEIVDFLLKLGYEVLQLGGSNEPSLRGTVRMNTSFFDSIRNMLGCKFLISGDSGCIWYASAYDFPTLGLYSSKYYLRNQTDYVHNIMPVNKNAIYLHEDNVNNITSSNIENSIKQLIK